MSQPPPPPPEHPPPSGAWSPAPPSPYGAPGGPAGYARTDGMAVASLVCGIVSFVMCLGGFTGIAAIILGILSRKKIDQSGGALTGRGMATAGLVLGIIAVALTVLFVVLIVILAATGELDDTDTSRAVAGSIVALR